MTGCIFSPDRKKGPPVQPPVQYPVLSAPERVLEALELSYANRDSAKYLSLFDGKYNSTSYDTSTAPGPQPGSFSRLAEERHIKALVENPNVIRVDLELGSDLIWDRTTTISDDGTEEWAQIIVNDPRIGVFMSNGDSDEAVSDLVLQFKFKPTTPANSPTDTLWTIVRLIEDGPPPQ